MVSILQISIPTFVATLHEGITIIISILQKRKPKLKVFQQFKEDHIASNWTQGSKSSSYCSKTQAFPFHVAT